MNLCATEKNKRNRKKKEYKKVKKNSDAIAIRVEEEIVFHSNWKNPVVGAIFYAKGYAGAIGE